MKKILVIFTLLIVAMQAPLCADIVTPAPLKGMITFPKNILNIPTVRLYHCGHKLITETRNNDLLFSTRKDTNLNQLFLLIACQISPVSARRNEMALLNTVDHLAVPEHIAYKFYALTYYEKDNRWTLSNEYTLNDERSIPDNTLIVLWDPSSIESVVVDSTSHTVQITCFNDLISRFGSESLLQEFAAKLQLEAINSDLFHQTGCEKIQLVTEKCRILRVHA